MWQVKPNQLQFALMRTLDGEMSYVLFCRENLEHERLVERTPEFVRWMAKRVETDLRDAEIEEALKLQPMRHDSHCINPEWCAMKNKEERKAKAKVKEPVPHIEYRFRVYLRSKSGERCANENAYPAIARPFEIDNPDFIKQEEFLCWLQPECRIKF